MWSAALQLLPLCGVAPSHISLLRALWTGRCVPISRSAALLALCVMPLIWAHTAAQALGAVSGVAYALAAMALSYAREVEGLRKL